ncbi:MAG: 8-oxo-dGTP diphosphatase [Eubacterium sp.]
MSKYEKVELTNMCMVYDDNGNVLVQDRVDKRWGGVTFPGGHIDEGESFVNSVIREVKEETGLDIRHPKICGIKQFFLEKDVRYIVLFYKTNEFSGTLKSSDEGEVFWIKSSELGNYKLAKDFDDMFRIFTDDDLQEFQWTEENGEWVKRIF